MAAGFKKNKSLLEEEKLTEHVREYPFYMIKATRVNVESCCPQCLK